MKRYSTYKLTLLFLCFFTITGLTACSPALLQTSYNKPDPIYLPDLSPSNAPERDDNLISDKTEPTPTMPPSSDREDVKVDLSSDSNDIDSTVIVTPPVSEITVSPTPAAKEPTPLPKNASVKLNVRGQDIYLEESSESLLNKLGSPSRIDQTEYNYEYYIYNNNYKKLLFVAISNNKVVGFYTDSLDFKFKGIASGSDMTTVKKVLGKELELQEILTHQTDTYTLMLFMDTIGTKKVTGISVLNKTKGKASYSDEVRRNIELMVYDLTNSIRVRNGLDVLSWSSSAALAARKHSKDMAENNYFDHINLKGQTPGERLKAEGIYYSSCGENIIAGYGNAFVSTHGWFNSSGHRNNMLNPDFHSLGVGFTYQAKSTYKTYITQTFYR